MPYIKCRPSNLLLVLIALLAMIFMFSYEAHGAIIDNPHKGYTYNYKGSLHVHSSSGPGGTESPATIAAWYRDNGFGFYSITDHDVVTANPGVAGILWIGAGEEDSYDGASGHMGHNGIAAPITTGTDQARIDSVLAQGGFTVLHHPARGDYAGWTAGEISALNGVLGFEVFNGGSDLNSSAIWDTVLTSGQTIWGVASDDSHQAAQHGDGYVVANSASASPTAAEIKAQLRSGNFYASRGGDVSVTVSNQTITASTTIGSAIRWIKESGGIIKTTTAVSDTYTVVGNEEYVRIEVLNGAGAPIAWSQPLDITGSVADHTSVQAFSGLAPTLVDAVKGMVLINSGQSHGTQIPHGLQTLQSQDAAYGVTVYNTEITGAPNGTLRVGRGLRLADGSWQNYSGPSDFWASAAGLNNVRRTLDYYSAQGITVDAILHTWCWHFRSWSAAEVDAYFVAMEQLESEYPGITFIYMTDTEDSTGAEGYNRHLRNEQVRAYCAANGKILFDYGEMETWSADGSTQATYLYGGSPIPLWNVDWQGAPQYGHISDTACTMKAEALWWLLAQISKGAPGQLDHIAISPNPKYVFRGETAAFSTTGYDSYDNSLGAVVSDWAATGGVVDPLNGASTVYTAGAVLGTYSVTASSGGKDAAGVVSVCADDAIAILYDYGRSTTGIMAMYSDGLNYQPPETLWNSGHGNWDAARSKPMIAQNGDVVFFYDYGNANSAVFTMTRTPGGGYGSPQRVWLSGAGNWDAARSRPMLASNGDVIIFYDYGNQNSAIFKMTKTGETYTPPALVWISGAGNWDAARSRPMLTSADDIMIFYDYGYANSAIFKMTKTGPTYTLPALVWISGQGNWESERSRPMLTSADDVIIFYDYGYANSAIMKMTYSGGTYTPPALVWISGAGNWESDRSRPMIGDYNGDGLDDVVIFYDYGNQNSAVMTMLNTGASFNAPRTNWLSGPGNWDASRSLVMIR